MDFNLQSVLDDGMVITVVGYVIVFMALVVLYFVFTYLARAMNFYIRKRMKRQGKVIASKEEVVMIPGDVSAAIALAVYFYSELHDEESNILTIERISRNYSPWSSKIYSIRGFGLQK
jgi:Na+-transporting methylmalonyl-CoA/oxaloacetate decarboxylase gamma subunit